MLKSDSNDRHRFQQVLLVLATMGAGLLLRSHNVPLPAFLVKYGGDSLWALLVFFAFGFLFPRTSTPRLAILSLSFAWAIEFLQLYHAPWIDSIRAMRIGHLVLGSTFNWPDLAAYGIGVAIGAAVETGWRKWRH